MAHKGTRDGVNEKLRGCRVHAATPCAGPPGPCYPCGGSQQYATHCFTRNHVLWLDSEAFDGLPQSARQFIYGRLADILSGRDQSAEFSKLSIDDRVAVSPDSRLNQT